MKYLLHTLYTLLLMLGIYSLYYNVELIIDCGTAEPFTDIMNPSLFIITGIIGIAFTRIGILSGIIAGVGALLLTFGLFIIAIYIDSNLYGVEQDLLFVSIASLFFLIIGLGAIIYSIYLNRHSKKMPNKSVKQTG